jgi:hypothetical protein
MVRRKTTKRKYTSRSRRSSTRRRTTGKSRTSRRRKSTRSRSRRRRRSTGGRCLSSRPVSWQPQKSSNLPLCPTAPSNPCANPCNNRGEWVKLALKNNYFLRWSTLLAHLSRCDPGTSICQPFGGVTPPEGTLLDFQKKFRPRVNVVIGLGNNIPEGSDKPSAYTLAHVELSFNNAVVAPPVTATIKGKMIAGENRGNSVTGISTDELQLENGNADPQEIAVVVGGVQRGSGSFDQFVEINGEAVMLAQDFCRMPAWPRARTPDEQKKDALMVPLAPGCCIPGFPGNAGGDIPIMRTAIPPGSALDDIMLGDCRVPTMKTGVGATLPSYVRRTLGWEKNPLSTLNSKTFFSERNKSLTKDAANEKFEKFKVILTAQRVCGQNLLEQLLINTIGDGTPFAGYSNRVGDVDQGDTENPGDAVYVPN